MIKKLTGIGSMIAVMALSSGLQAAVFEPASIEDTPANSADGFIQVVNKQETDIPGYFHQKYVFWHQGCVGGSNPVDFYGPPIDPTDVNLLKNELRLCKENPDGGSDNSD